MGRSGCSGCFPIEFCDTAGVKGGVSSSSMLHESSSISLLRKSSNGMSQSDWTGVQTALLRLSSSKKDASREKPRRRENRFELLASSRGMLRGRE